MLSLNTKPVEFYKRRMPDMKRTPYTFSEANLLWQPDTGKFCKKK